VNIKNNLVMRYQMAKEVENGMCCFSLEDYLLHSDVDALMAVELPK